MLVTCATTFAAARFLLRAALLALAVLPAALAHGPGAFKVENPRVRVEAGQALVYVTLLNKASKPVKIVGAFSPAAERLELRRGTKTLNSLEVAANGRVDLAPGAYTIALTKLRRSLKPGDVVPVILRLEDGDTFAVLATVAQ